MRWLSLVLISLLLTGCPRGIPFSPPQYENGTLKIHLAQGSADDQRSLTKAVNRINTVAQASVVLADVASQEADVFAKMVPAISDLPSALGVYRWPWPLTKARIEVLTGLKPVVLEHVWTHEVMHAMGIPHSLDRDSVMYYQVWKAGYQRITPRDEESIRQAAWSIRSTGVASIEGRGRIECEVRGR